jgi:hypothetical protein
VDLRPVHFLVDPFDEQESVGLLYLQWSDWAVKDDVLDWVVDRPLFFCFLLPQLLGLTKFPQAYLFGSIRLCSRMYSSS